MGDSGVSRHEPRDIVAGVWASSSRFPEKCGGQNWQKITAHRTETGQIDVDIFRTLMSGPPNKGLIFIDFDDRHSLHTGGVTGSIPVSPTISRIGNVWFRRVLPVNSKIKLINMK